MAGRDRRGLRFAFFRSKHRVALAVSIALHAALLIGLTRMSWRSDLPPPRVSPPVVWLGEWRPPPRDDPAAEAPAPSEPEPVPIQPEARADMPVEPVPEEPAESVADEPPAVPRSGEPGEERETAEAPSPRILTRDVDWEEERRRAIRELVEEGELEARYRTFSLDDLRGPEPPPEEPGPSRSIFTPGAGGDPPRSILPRGQARTKVGRFLSELCHALTGGFGMSFQGVGLGSACAENEEGRSDLFAHLKPEYLRRRPEDFVNPRSVGARPAEAVAARPDQTEEPAAP